MVVHLDDLEHERFGVHHELLDEEAQHVEEEGSEGGNMGEEGACEMRVAMGGEGTCTASQNLLMIPRKDSGAGLAVRLGVAGTGMPHHPENVSTLDVLGGVHRVEVGDEKMLPDCTDRVAIASEVVVAVTGVYPFVASFVLAVGPLE